MIKKLIHKSLFILLIVAISACNGSDFVITGPKPTNITANQNFVHDTFNNISCIECHEVNRPLTSPAHGDNRNCIECHTAEITMSIRSWKNLIKFNHNNEIKACSLCHLNAIPLTTPHVKGQVGDRNDCIFCHDSNNWKEIKFNHQSLYYNNCNQCHITQNRNSLPTNEPHHPNTNYEKIDCIYCHEAQEPSANWKDLKFDQRNHTPQPIACNICHELQRPVLHITNPTTVGMDHGECVLCHGSTHDWKLEIKQFNHESSHPINCVACHQNDTPKNELAHPTINGNYRKLDCVLCHTYFVASNDMKRTWSTLIFDQRTHLKEPQICMSCHLNVNDSRPINESHSKLSRANNDCTKCHIYDAIKLWKNYSKFSHTLLETSETCESCHGDQATSVDKKSSAHVPTHFNCIDCHTTLGWKPAIYKHAITDTDCISCHNGKMANDRPTNHQLSHRAQCSSCHEVNDWKKTHYDVNFNHPDSSNMPPRTKDKVTLSHKRQNECSLCHDSKSDSVIYKFNYGTTCASCHADDSKKFIVHKILGVDGIKNCITCHTYSDWDKIL